jgi:hypothetical protein
MKQRLRARLRAEALARDGQTCRQCGATPDNPDILEVAHITPRTLGGEETLDNLVTVCPNCHAQFDRDYVAEIIRGSPGSFPAFQSVIATIRELNGLDLPRKQAAAFHNLLFASVIGALETYLSDTIVGAVDKDERLVEKAVAAIPELKVRKVDLPEIFDRVKAIRGEVRDTLLDISFHNLGRVKPLYESVLGIRFPDDLEDIIRAVRTRHDIVHRSGKTKDGRPVKMTREDVERTLSLVEAFVTAIQLQLPPPGNIP